MCGSDRPLQGSEISTAAVGSGSLCKSSHFAPDQPHRRIHLPFSRQRPLVPPQPMSAPSPSTPSWRRTPVGICGGFGAESLVLFVRSTQPARQSEPHSAMNSHAASPAPWSRLLYRLHQLRAFGVCAHAHHCHVCARACPCHACSRARRPCSSVSARAHHTLPAKLTHTSCSLRNGSSLRRQELAVRVPARLRPPPRLQVQVGCHVGMR